jgi:uncharacterized protein YbcI
MSLSRTQGEVEAKIGSDLSRFYVELFSRGPKSIQVNMLPTSAVVVTQNNFTVGEKKMMSDGRHQQAFKDMRTSMIASRQVELTSLVEEAVGVLVKCMHHDLTPEEEAFVFSLNGRPEYRRNHIGNGHASRYH